MDGSNAKTTDWAGLPARLSQSSAIQTRTTKEITTAQQRLEPAGRDVFRQELTRCIGLVALSGMSDADRTEWMRLAYMELRHLPAEVLSAGCAAARKQADHPAKIVPIIIKETEDWMRILRKALSSAWEAAPRLSPPAQPEPEYATPEQAAAILAEYGLKTEYTPAASVHRGPPKYPTRADYIALGVDPENLA